MSEQSDERGAEALLMLRGADHPDLGEREVLALDAEHAIGISAGRLPKSYWHLDPNEDAALLAVSPTWALLAVADGHHGADASHAAIEAIAVLAETAGPVAAATLVKVAARTAAEAVDRAVRTAGEGRDLSRTALSIAAVAEGTVCAATWGDTGVVHLRTGRRGRPKELTRHGSFLGPGGSVPAITTASVRSGDRLVLCSDGISDYLGGRWVDRVAEAAEAARSAEALVVELLDLSSNGGAGDHQAAAVLLVP